MDCLTLATLAISWDVQGWMQHAFYPVLLLVLVGASFGVPIPEDVPLLAAGVILSQRPEVASWGGTLLTAMLGIMCGDTVLYVLGKRWGPEVYQHRWVSWLITPARLEKMTSRFNRYGMWMCFFGRFFMGVRAAMCITAGVTRLVFWRFLVADAAGALLSIPLLVWLGYWFGTTVPHVEAYVHFVQWGLLALALLILVGFVFYRRRKGRQPCAGDGDAAPATSSVHESADLGQPGSPESSQRPPRPRKPQTCS
jgi:membrane protein DedA with SNARE-associated domain